MDQKPDVIIEVKSDTSTVDGDIGTRGQRSKKDVYMALKLKLIQTCSMEQCQNWMHNTILSVYLIGLIIDPLFLYIPIIDEKNKCLEMDKNLTIAALILRSIFDLPYLISFCLHALVSILDGFMFDFKPDQEANSLSLWLQRLRIPKKAIPFFIPVSKVIAFAKAVVVVMRCSSLLHLALLLSILPTPQVAIIVFFFRRRSYENVFKTRILNAFLFFQYLPRFILLVVVFGGKYRNRSKWIKGSFNFALYIYSSHVLGAFWYFFSIQRDTLCWHQACKNTPGCTATYYCDDTSTPTNMKILYDLCPINPENATLFDYGIFLDAFQSGTTGQKNFLTKLFYCLWWGLRNLSNLGTNLETSSYLGENCFAILISIGGLLLFSYLIGNMQAYMRLQVTKSEVTIPEELNELQSMIEKKKPMIESWVDRHHVPNFIRFELFRKQCGKKLKERIDVDVDVKGQLSVLSKFHKDLIVGHLCMNTLRKVPMLQNMNVRVLKKICKYLEPVIYTENSYVFREGNPLSFMLFIIDGTILTYKTNGDNAAKTGSGSSSMMNIKWLKEGDYYGEELLSYCSTPNCSFSQLPISMEDVQCQTKVEAFVLKAKDLRLIMVNQSWGI